MNAGLIRSFLWVVKPCPRAHTAWAFMFQQTPNYSYPKMLGKCLRPSLALGQCACCPWGLPDHLS